MDFSALTVHAFTGGAGCGKTYRLLAALQQRLAERPLEAHQKVLALTFMHGSRRRLDEDLRLKPAMRAYECCTVDSFAWRIAHRWRSLCAHLGFEDLRAGELQRIMEAAGAILRIPIVCRWMAATFPILIVDEAQDLTVARLDMIKSLATSLEVFAAADEFQCLDEELRPNPACAWLTNADQRNELTEPRRTTITELLDAAHAVRDGTAPRSGTIMRIELTPKVPFAAAWVSNNIGMFARGRTVAVISPARGPFFSGILEHVRSKKTKRGQGPFAIRSEESDRALVLQYMKALALPDGGDRPAITAAFERVGDHRVAEDVSSWLTVQRRTQGRTTWSCAEIEQAVTRSFALRQRQQKPSGGRVAMSVHAAKNREFDCVIVLWPAATQGSDEQKRRLLYNAITRAKERCLVLVQAKANLAAPPFVASPSPEVVKERESDRSIAR